jgi:hypothetical protein
MPTGFGLEPIESTDDLPNYVTPKMDGIGANEYIVTVTQDAVDIYSAGNTRLMGAEYVVSYSELRIQDQACGKTVFLCV